MRSTIWLFSIIDFAYAVAKVDKAIKKHGQPGGYYADRWNENTDKLDVLRDVRNGLPGRLVDSPHLDFAGRFTPHEKDDDLNPPPVMDPELVDDAFPEFTVRKYLVGDANTAGLLRERIGRGLMPNGEVTIRQN